MYLIEDVIAIIKEFVSDSFFLFVGIAGSLALVQLL